jgi:protein TonB
VSSTLLTAPTAVAPIALEPTLDLDGPPRIVGLPADWPDTGDEGPGFCLFDCGHGPQLDPPKPAVDVQPNPNGPLRLRGGDLRLPVKTRHVAPVYPALAVAAHVQGTVVLDCVIDEAGRVSSVSVLRGHALLDAAAVEAVQQWRYRPTLLNGVRVSVLLTVTVDFRLR